MRHSSRHDEDDTVILPAPKRGMPKVLRARPSVAIVGLLTVGLLAGGSIALWRGSTPPAPLPPALTEASIDINAACVTHVGVLAQDHDILVITFSSLLMQGQTLNRVAAFVEKADQPRDHILDDTALLKAIHESGADEQTYYYGHDYQAEDLRRFFAQAARQSVTLNPQEIWLQKTLAGMGLLQPNATGALITLSASGEALESAMRAIILRHEIAHGAFYTVPAYRAYTEQFWLALPAPERAAFTEFMGQQGYDTTQEALMFNEMQAYLAFTPDTRFFNAQVIGMSDKRLEALRASFLNGMPDFWLRNLAREPLPPASVSSCPNAQTSPPT